MSQVPQPTVRIELNGTFSATELEEVISDLAATRATLQPEVPATPPTLVTDAQVETETLFKIRTLATGGVRIWLRHVGYGWLGFTLSPTQRTEFVEFVQKRAGHSHTAH